VHRLSITLPRYDEDRVAAPSNDAPDSRDDPGDGDPSDDDSGTSLSPWWLLVAVAAAGVAAALWQRRRRPPSATKGPMSGVR
jgi:hypothetical protein